MTEENTKEFHMSSNFYQKFYSFWRTFKIQDQMKTKNFYIFILFIGASTLSLWLLSNPTPHLHTIVTQTHIQINNIKNIPENIRTSNKEEYNVDPDLLEDLGFMTEPGSFKEPKKDVDDFIIGTAITPGHYAESINLIKSCLKYLPAKKIQVYDLGINHHQQKLIKTYCNETKMCTVKKFEFDLYPSHVKDLDIRSYRPIAIQELLRDFGGNLLWVEPPEVLLTGQIHHLIKRAQMVGLLVWTIKDPVSSLTYTKMFKYFKAHADDYYFRESAKTSQMIIYNSEKIHKEVMLLWVKCALVEECISPTGAENSACNYGRKPLFKYSGCHKYDMAALNVILGKIFVNDYSDYTTMERVFAVPKIIPPQSTDSMNMYVSHNVTTNYTERLRLNQIP